MAVNYLSIAVSTSANVLELLPFLQVHSLGSRLLDFPGQTGNRQVLPDCKLSLSICGWMCIQQGCQIWSEIGPDWTQMGQIWDNWVPDLSHLLPVWPNFSKNRTWLKWFVMSLIEEEKNWNSRFKMPVWVTKRKIEEKLSNDAIHQLYYFMKTCGFPDLLNFSYYWNNLRQFI